MLNIKKRISDAASYFGHVFNNLDHVSPEVEIPFVHLGSDYAGYGTDVRGLGPASVIYSLGIGEDVSWDLALIELCGVEVHAFDFTPRALAYAERLSPNLRVHAYGVAALDGELTFYAPYQAKNVSWSNIPRPTETRVFPVKRLVTVMCELGHSHIDVLKMDIEGAEYVVLSDMLGAGIRPGQILIEFQHRFRGVGVSHTKRALRALHEAGYHIFDASPDKTEFSFSREHAM